MTYAVTFNSITNKIIITNTIAQSFSLIFTNVDTYKLFGLPTGTTTGTSISSNQSPSFQPITQICIQCSEFGFTPVRNAANTTNQYTFLIPIDVNKLYIQNYTDQRYFDQNLYYKNSTRNFTELNIKLFDQNNNLLDLNGSEWYFVIKAHYKCSTGVVF